ncbi:MAG: lipoyl(octanoyl) transferase LipB [Burkholderiales bacterium]|nr:lipoyl(octanoyl) transferase LipB [Burkholderiales bacterium]
MTALAAEAEAAPPRVRRLGLADYIATWQAMRGFTANRTAGTADELWVTEHPPVYTLGVAGRSAHLPRAASTIPVVRTDRGGQITYHGPGQLVLYLLLDMRRRALAVRPLVRIMERAVLDWLTSHGVAGEARPEAPGVYVGGAKIAALGLRVSNGRCYHGLAVNIDMDLSPFDMIDPCGYPGLRVTQARELGVPGTLEQAGEELVSHLERLLP